MNCFGLSQLKLKLDRISSLRVLNYIEKAQIYCKGSVPYFKSHLNTIWSHESKAFFILAYDDTEVLTI